ncbi:hypothetical protein LXL04_020522 [Taraxacum kok-saghyz]
MVDQGPLTPSYGPISPWNHQATISDSDLKPHKTFELPTNHQTNIDLPLSPNARYYSRSFTRRPSKPQKFCAFDIIRADKSEQQISEADFLNLNPSDIFTIARHFEEQRFRTHTATSPYLAALYFLRDYVAEIGRFDFELFEMFWNTPPNPPDLTLPSFKGRLTGPTNEPELGFIFHIKGKDKLGFFSTHKFDTKFLQKFVQKTLQKENTTSAETRSRICDEINWWIGVRNWILNVCNFTKILENKNNSN